jgi:dynamin 1-like protein
MSQNHTISRYNHEQVTNAVSWLSNYLPAARSEKEASTESSPTHQNDVKGVLSPQKPVNLLPEVPIQTGRKLSEREQRDCDVIGMHILSQAHL